MRWPGAASALLPAWLAMILAEIDIADRIHDSVPVEPGMRDCSASSWLWIVTMGLEWSRVRSGSAGMVGSCGDAMLGFEV